MNKNKIAIQLSSLFILTLPFNSHAFTLTGVAADGGWDDVNKKAEITTVIDSSDFTSDMSSSSVNTALTNAYNSWDNVSAATNLNFNFLPDLGGNYDLFDGPGASTDSSSDWSYANITFGGFLPNSYFDSLSPNGSNILAVAVSGKMKSRTEKKPQWHSDIFFNDSWNWTDDAALAQQDFNTGLANRIVDLETVAVHEIGHTLGFGHEDSVESVMATYYNGVQRELFADDLLAAEFLYSNSLLKGGGGNGGGNGGGKGRNRLNFDLIGNGRITSIVFGKNFDADIFSAEVQFSSQASSIAVPEPCTTVGIALSSMGAAYLRRKKKVAEAT